MQQRGVLSECDRRKALKVRSLQLQTFFTG
jgi:hypothetical protein